MKDYDRIHWTVPIAAQWSGLPPRLLYELLKAGIAPGVPAGRVRTQNFPPAKSGKRQRYCYKFVIPAAAFKRWFEGVSPEDTKRIHEIQQGLVDPPRQAA